MSVTTERLELRAFMIGDASAVHAYGSDPAVCEYMDWGPNTWDETLDFLARVTSPSNPGVDVAIVERDSGMVIGGTGGRPVGTGRWELGWVLRADAWGKGYGTEAARAIATELAARDDVVSLEARCRPENRASARIMEKIGMHYVKRIDREREVRGAFVDSLLYQVPAERVLAAAAKPHA